jgi:hypothetical protein
VKRQAAQERRGFLRELAIGVSVIALLAVVLAVVFSSPDERPSTIRQWSRADPVGFLKTAILELGGTSETAEYGPPYNHSADGEHAAFVHLQKWLGVTHPIDTANDFVVDPLRTVPDRVLQGEISEYLGSPLKIDGVESFERIIYRAKVGPDRSVTIRPGEYENVDNMMRALLRLAQSGGVDGYLLAGNGFFETDYTKPLLFMSDGGLLERRARNDRLPGHQWMMMTETGSYPGLPWLWPYAVWYQIEPFRSSSNVDLLVWLLIAGLSLTFVCVPVIPGVRRIPLMIPLHRVIARER